MEATAVDVEAVVVVKAAVEVEAVVVVAEAAVVVAEAVWRQQLSWRHHFRGGVEAAVELTN